MGVIAPAKLIDPVVLQAPRGGLLSAVDVVPGDVRTQGGVQWELSPVGVATIAPDDCLPQDPIEVPDGIPWAGSEAIRVRAGFTCRAPGLDEASINGRAQQALAGVESATLEAAVWDRLRNGAGVVTLPGAANLNAAVGAIEAYLWARYGGTPLIHVPRQLAVQADDNGIVHGDATRLTTLLGSRISFGNYSAFGPQLPGTPADPEAEPPVPEGPPVPQPGLWLLGTGQMVVFRGEAVVKPGTMAEGFDRKTNGVFAVAERAFAYQVDGPVLAIKVG